MLLGRGNVSPDQADTKYGLTPLSWAAVHGRERVAKILLERPDVNPNREDTKYGYTPLSWAAVHGHEKVIKVLLESKDVHTATPANMNQSSLPSSLSKGHDRVVMPLLELGGINYDPADRVC
jgi:ankyrin repeat protein